MGFHSRESMAVHRSTKPASGHSAPPSDGRENPVAGGASAAPPARGDRIRCAACRALNPPTNRFCHDCGHGLWEPCYQCGTSNAATEKFCGACGANLLDWLQEQLAQLDGELDRATQLEREGHFDKALALLRTIAALQDSRLRDFAERAAQRIPQCVSQSRAWQEKTIAAEKKARDLMLRRDFQQALVVLEAVPPAVRTEESARLIEECRSSLRDIGQLSVELDTLGQAALTPEALAKVGRLLTLQPDHAEAARLGARISARLVEVAQLRLAKCRYSEVKKILSQIPESLQTDELRAIRDRAWEMLHLRWDLSSAPLIDECLVELAAKARQMAPQDDELALLCTKLEKRFRDHPRNLDQIGPGWKTLPEHAAIGLPVEWATGLGQIELDPALDPAPLLQNPGRFAVACGAALQGLGEAAIEINLLPDDGKLWQKAVRWLSKRRARSAWGIDLGSSGLKAVKLTRGDDPAEPVVLAACDVVEHDKILSQAASETQQRSLIEASVGMFFAKNDCTADRVCLSLPPRSVWVRPVEMPPLTPDKFDAALQYAGIGAFPMALADLEWRSAILDESAALADPPGKIQVGLFGVNRLLLKTWLAAMHNMGLRIDIVQHDCLALHNFVSYAFGSPDAEAHPETPSSDAPVAILDIGADSTNFIVSGRDWLWFRTASMGVDRASKALVRQFRIPFAKAEQWKRNPASAANSAALYEAVQPVFEDLFQEVKTELDAYQQAYPQRPVQRILALGGGIRLHGLLRYLWLRK